MKQLHPTVLKTVCPAIIMLALLTGKASAQSCTPQGNQTSYGANNKWIGYVYQGNNFDTYKGYVNEGTTSNPNFDEDFGGSQINYSTNGCNVYTDNFSVRYKLKKSFSNGNYDFTVSGDDGYRLSLDGGATWVIDNWSEHSYTSTTYSVLLNGNYNMVLEFFESYGDNRVTFSVAASCTGNGNPASYGTSNTWKGYLYQGKNFDAYKGFITEGNNTNMNFDEDFGGSNTTFSTSNCSVTTEQFSARFRLRKTFSAGSYTITVGGDDGYRLSLDGGSTWVIDKWNDQSYNVTTYTGTLSGSYDLVLEYYESGGDNRISFSLSSGILPVTLTNWSAIPVAANKVQLNWKTATAINFHHFVLQRSMDGNTFSNIQAVAAHNNNSNTEESYSYTDMVSFNGTLYYRLAMTDIDGSTKYSSVAPVNMKSESMVKIYPAIIDNGTVYIESGKQVANSKIEIFDMNGRMMVNATINLGLSRQSLSLQSNGKPAAGSYIVRVTGNNEVLAKQVIIVK